ncbi:MGMT family protein [Chitinophagaceae bacterium MMS25-I14]
MKTKPDNDNIYDTIFEIVRQVPKGRVTSYGAVAAAIGMKSGARLVGHALRDSPNARPKVPAHRVVNSKGLLSGMHHFNPPSRMQELLEKEGIKVSENQVQDFKKIFWDPAKEITI